MQINLLNINFKKVLGYLGWILLFISIWLKGCSSDNKSVKNITVKTPEVKAVLETKKPYQKPIVVAEKGETVYLSNPINAKLLQENEKLKLDYSKMSDSLKSKAYEKAIELNQFSSKFEDENILLNIDGIVQGEIQEMTPNYIWKSKEIPVEIKQKEVAFRLLAGGGLGVNRDFNQVIYKIDVDFQNKKGNILSGEYLRLNNQDYGLIGFKKSIFTIKK